MRFGGNFRPEWHYFVPAPSFIRTLGIVAVAAAVGASAGAAVVFSLVEPPPAEESVAARTLARPTNLTPAGSQTAQVQIPPSAPAPAPAKEHVAAGASGSEPNSIITRPTTAAVLAEAPAATDATPPQAAEPAAAAPSSPKQKTVARTIFDLTLRAAPDPHSEKVLEKIPKDAVVELAADFPSGCRKGPSIGTWCPVAYDNHDGWVNAFYLAARARPTIDLPLRKSPDLRSDIVLDIPKGGIMEIDHLSECRTAEEAGSMVPWCPGRYAGRSGWLNPMFLSFEGRA